MKLKSKIRKRNERGYVLLAILFALTVLIIAMAAVAPRVTTAVQREKENELVRRGQQYQLAIRRFYKKFGRYPSSIDQLENTNNIRFLRRRYLDPLTGKDDWTPIQFGQARPALGFFGQKVVTTGGLSPSGPGLSPSTIGTGAGSGSSSNTSSFGSNTSTFGSNSSSFGSGTSTFGSSSFGSGANSGSPSAGATDNSSPAGNTTTNSSSSGTATNSPAGPAGSAGNPLSSDQLSGKTFGGGAIVGMSVPSQKESLKEFQQQKHYNEWQFVYDPTMDTTLRGGISTAGAAGANGLNSTQNPGGINSQNPSGFNSSPFGGSMNQPQPTTQPISPMQPTSPTPH